MEPGKNAGSPGRACVFSTPIAVIARPTGDPVTTGLRFGHTIISTMPGGLLHALLSRGMTMNRQGRPEVSGTSERSQGNRRLRPKAAERAEPDRSRPLGSLLPG